MDVQIITKLKDSEDYYKFKQMLLYIMTDLAKSIARDGEGASKLIEVTVKGAKESSAARMIAKSVVGSSLVKPQFLAKILIGVELLLLQVTLKQILILIR